MPKGTSQDEMMLKSQPLLSYACLKASGMQEAGRQADRQARI